jgi:hypothetical protein
VPEELDSVSNQVETNSDIAVTAEFAPLAVASLLSIDVYQNLATAAANLLGAIPSTTWEEWNRVYNICRVMSVGIPLTAFLIDIFSPT